MVTLLPDTLATVDPADADLTVSVVVCAYSAARRSLLDRCLDSILGQLAPGDELIVVIDHNHDLLRALSIRAADGLTVVPNRFGYGLSGARNTGVAECVGNIVAFVDDDAQVEPGWLELARAHYSDPTVMAVGGYAQPVWPQRRPGWFPDEFDWVVGCSHRGLPSRTSPVRNVIGCNMTFRRSALQSAGGFSSRVGRVGAHPQGCEETELCIRLHNRSSVSRILFDPAICVRHVVSSDRVSPRYFLRRCFAEGVSKSLVSSMVGVGAALSTERNYVARVLPAGLVRYVWGSVTGPHRASNVARGVAVVLGLVVTVLGYGATSVRLALWRR